MSLVVDASVALCWFAREKDSPAAIGLLRSGMRLVAPSFICVEVANVAWKKLRKNEMTEDQARASAVEIRRFIDEFAPIEPLAPAAFDMAREVAHSVYDCVYLALAVQRAEPLVTLDQEFAARLSDTRYAGSVVHLSDWRPG